MSNLTDYAEKELRLAGMFDKDSDYGGELGRAVLDLVAKFADEGHSGGSAMLTLQMFSRLARFKPLTPLTGAPEEWMKVGADTWQNIRCSSVFKNATHAYDINAKEPRAAITFPYNP